jgi:hypothetical protein
MQGKELFKPETFPTSNLCELDLSSGIRFEKDGEDKLNALVAASINLRFLHIGSGFRFFAASGKLPAIRELGITGHWPYTSKEIPDIFDFSKLTTLSMAGLAAHPFLDSVSPRLLPAVRRLKITSSRNTYSFSEQVSFSARVSDFIGKLDGLQDIDVTTSHPTELIESFAKHGRTLRTLSVPTMKDAEEWLEYAISFPEHFILILGQMRECRNLFFDVSEILRD